MYTKAGINIQTVVHVHLPKTHIPKSTLDIIGALLLFPVVINSFNTAVVSLWRGLIRRSIGLTTS